MITRTGRFGSDSIGAQVYLDNAATSFPKPPAVLHALTDFATRLGASPGRGSYAQSREAGHLLSRCRQRINQLIGGANPDHVIFTLNCSDALNLGIKGLIRPGDHVITTRLDHNSILRPLNRLVSEGVIEQTRLECDPTTGIADPQALRRALRPNTRLIAVLHGSNVTGTLQPIEEFGRIARENEVHFLVDAAQTLGHRSINVQQMNIDLLAAPGHKGLLGPLGTGFLYIRPGLEREMNTVREGGTGSVSEMDVQPDFLPDRFEPGSHNTIGLVGLSEGVQYILERGIDDIERHERKIMRTFSETLAAADVPGLRIYGPTDPSQRTGVYSVRIEGFENPQELSNVLEQQFGILTRSGLHCAPGAHATIGTVDRGGTTRLSFGTLNTLEEARLAAHALATICQRTPAGV